MDDLANAVQAPALCLTAEELAQELRISLRKVRRMDAAGQLPRPVTLGSRVVWLREEIVRWLRAKCPTRLEWESTD